MQRRWFKECKENSKVQVLRSNETEFVIYKGFKLEKTNDGLRLFDVRFFDFYSRVSKRDKKVLKKYGFIKGCDVIKFERDKFRIDKYEKDLERLFTKKSKYLKKLKVSKVAEDIRLLKKNINIIDRKAREVVDLLFFYRNSKEQFKLKYNVEIKN